MIPRRIFLKNGGLALLSLGFAPAFLARTSAAGAWSHKHRQGTSSISKAPSAVGSPGCTLRCWQSSRSTVSPPAWAQRGLVHTRITVRPVGRS